MEKLLRTIFTWSFALSCLSASASILIVPQQTCAQHCIMRNDSGNCIAFTGDTCGQDMKCVPQCTFRRADGTCGNYHADFCGVNANCVTNCTFRLSDGSCATYGADICSLQPDSFGLSY